jgi:glyoxylase-like metal-dependent hydrolase (beta-lactamase superfamily II)
VYKCNAGWSAGTWSRFKENRFFIIHLHADYIGLASSLARDTSTIYFNRSDAERIKSGFLWDDFANFARLKGYPENELQTVPNSHPGFKFGSKGKLAFHILKEGDIITIGKYVFRCVETPGHAEGHTCLYKQKRRSSWLEILFLKT